MTLDAWTFALTDTHDRLLALALVCVEARYCGVRGRILSTHPCLHLVSNDWSAIDSELRDLDLVTSRPVAIESTLVDLLTRGLGTIIRVGYLSRTELTVETAEEATAALDDHLAAQAEAAVFLPHHLPHLDDPPTL